LKLAGNIKFNGSTAANPVIRTPNASGSGFRVYDQYHNQTITEFYNGGNVEIPNGLLEISGTAGAPSLTLAGHLNFNGSQANNAVLRTPNASGADFHIYDEYYSNTIATFNNGGDVKIPTGRLHIAGRTSGNSLLVADHIGFDGTNDTPVIRTPNSSTGQIRIYDNYNGQDIIRFNNSGNVEIPHRSLNMGGETVYNLQSPNADDHAVPRGWANSTYLNASGDTLEGRLNVGFNNGTIINARDGDGTIDLTQFDDGASTPTEYRVRLGPANNNAFKVDDVTNNNPLLNVETSGHVVVPSGPIEVSGTTGSDNSLLLSGHIKFDGTLGHPAIRTPNTSGSSFRIYDQYNSSPLMDFANGGPITAYRWIETQHGKGIRDESGGGKTYELIMRETDLDVRYSSNVPEQEGALFRVDDFVGLVESDNDELVGWWDTEFGGQFSLGGHMQVGNTNLGMDRSYALNVNGSASISGNLDANQINTNGAEVNQDRGRAIPASDISTYEDSNGNYVVLMSLNDIYDRSFQQTDVFSGKVIVSGPRNFSGGSDQHVFFEANFVCNRDTYGNINLFVSPRETNSCNYASAEFSESNDNLKIKYNPDFPHSTFPHGYVYVHRG